MGAVEPHLAALDGEAAGAGDVGNVARRHRAVELAGLAGLAQHHEGLALQRHGDALGFLAGLQVACLELNLVAFEALAARLVGAQRLALRARGSCAHSRP